MPKNTSICGQRLNAEFQGERAILSKSEGKWKQMFHHAEQPIKDRFSRATFAAMQRVVSIRPAKSYNCPHHAVNFPVLVHCFAVSLRRPGQRHGRSQATHGGARTVAVCE